MKLYFNKQYGPFSTNTGIQKGLESLNYYLHAITYNFKSFKASYIIYMRSLKLFPELFSRSVYPESPA